ncbi:MAG TPA: hypothetical protein VJQ06_01205 [Rhizomicrobium sp.]|nr:hypothetical protein [Rhizomicrobium sp.]
MDMRATLTPFHFFGIMLAAALAALIAACALPHDSYLRWRSISDQAVVKAAWIYERIHFDPSPIDVVFIGTSHSVFGIDSKNVEQACLTAKGRRCASVNFALQHLGRNLHWLVAREVIQARKPRLMFIEVQETEFRALHPAYAYLADSSDIVSAPLLINTSYFPDLARLPLRQFTLFMQSRLPSLFGTRLEFSDSLYRGSHWNDTYSEAGSFEHPIAHPTPRTRVISVAELKRQRAHFESTDASSLHLPRPLRSLEYRANLLYLKDILTLARRRGVEVRFLYVPTYHGPMSPSFGGFYKAFAPTWPMPQEITDNHIYWNDIAHLNHDGAIKFSRWLGAGIAKGTLVSTAPQPAVHHY